jgi:hypothetical protein
VGEREFRLARKDKPGLKADVAAHPDLMRGLMTSVVHFMARTGMSDTEISKVFRSCLTERAGGRKSSVVTDGRVVAYGCDTVAGAVLRAWHRFPKYLDGAARPIPLRVDGAGSNLSTLVLSQSKKADPADVIKSMVNAGLLRSHGVRTYLPAKDSATIDSLDPLSVDHIAKTVMRLVETASRNVAKSKNKLSLIERYAHVPDLTRAESTAFAMFSKQQGQACLDAIEDWLETRQVRGGKRRSGKTSGVNAGVHIFAYLGGAGASDKGASLRKPKPRSTPSRAARA